MLFLQAKSVIKVCFSICRMTYLDYIINQYKNLSGQKTVKKGSFVYEKNG